MVKILTVTSGLNIKANRIRKTYYEILLKIPPSLSFSHTAEEAPEKPLTFWSGGSN